MHNTLATYLAVASSLLVSIAIADSCSWAGHCLGASCQTDNDCSDSYTCINGVCAAARPPANDPGCNWLGHCLGATCQTYNDCADPWPCVGGVCSNCTGSCGTGSFVSISDHSQAPPSPGQPEAHVVNDQAADCCDDSEADWPNAYTPQTFCVLSSFPDRSQWVRYPDMFNANKPSMTFNHASEDQQGQIWDAIDSVARVSRVDRRLILAVMMKESKGDPAVRTTYSPDNIPNPGLMQTHNGTTYDWHDSHASIRQMIQDGTQGTVYGDGLVQAINEFGNVFKAVRYYNSGHVSSDNLCDNVGNTDWQYASEIANTLLGWVN